MIGNGIDSICVNTGNLISCKEFNRRATQSPVEEVQESINCTLRAWVENKTDNVEQGNLQVIKSRYALQVDKDDRVNLKLTVKVFLQDFSNQDLEQAINNVMNHLNASFIDSVILALPNITSSALTLEKIKPLWKALEELASQEKVVTIGISDLDTVQLSELYNWSKVKPSVNQVNLESCCVMPPEMTAFAKDNDIQLLTHSDPKDLLSQQSLETLLEPIVAEHEQWQAKWLVRYSVVVKCRGIIQNKGYLLLANKKHTVSNSTD